MSSNRTTIKNNSKNNRSNRNQTRKNTGIQTNEDQYVSRKEFDETIQSLLSSIARLEHYNQTEATFQEVRDREMISDLYLQNHPTHYLKKIDVGKFFLPGKGKDLTDFDGFLLVRDPIYMNQPNSVIHKRNNNTYSFSLASNTKAIMVQPNQSPIQPIFDFILIESKHSLSLHKLHKKLNQMKHIINVFSGKVADPATIRGEQSYKDTLQRIMDGSGLTYSELNRPIHLIFASDDIPLHLRIYLQRIHEGITSKEQYDNVLHEVFFMDPDIIEWIGTLNKDRTIPSMHKLPFLQNNPVFAKVSSMQVIREILGFDKSKSSNQLAQDAVTYAKIRERIKKIGNPFTKDDRAYNFMIDLLIEYVTDKYHSLSDVFSAMKGRIGYLRFNKIYHPVLFHEHISLY